ncbi:MAG: CPBP family intramembrane metalloprotease [Chitinophagaceae bacterium]|nr:CPBP family intramembrane metalloprotease [Chitinophagaceae bacterium]
MYDSYSKGISYGKGILILIGLWLGGFFMGGVASIPIWFLMTGRGIFTMQQDMLKPEYVNAIRVIQVVSTFITFFLPAYFTALILNRKPVKLLGFTMRFTYKQLFLSVVVMFAAALAAGALAELNEKIPLPKATADFFKRLEDTYAEQVEAITNIKSFGDYIISLIMIAILPALFEETFFRGGMQNLLTRSTQNHWMAIIITSIIFSAIHISYYGFLTRLCLGIVLGLIYYYSRSLWLSIAAHCFNNAFAVTQMYVMLRQGKSVKEAMDDKMPFWWGIIAVIALYFLFMIFKRVSNQAIKAFTPPEDKALEEKWIA